MGRIQLKDVQKTFGNVEVIPPLNLEIEDGEFVVFVGPSGCGKSTLLRLIAGLEDTTSGNIEIDDIDATDLPPAKRSLAMVFQSYALYPHMSVRKNIAFPMKMAKIDLETQNTKVEAAAKSLNLTDYLDRKPGQLSGGQRQRVAIGRAIVREPAAFLFDEPLSNLDAALRVGMRLEIMDLHKKLETTMIYVTHDQVEAMTMADKIVVLYQGSVVEIGTPQEIFKTPKEQYTRALIQARPKPNKRLKKLPTIEDFKLKVIEEELVSFKERNKRLEKIYAQEPLLSVRNLNKTYTSRNGFFGKQEKFTAINDLSFDLYPGETLGLVGASGCGKSTLGKALVYLNKPSKGEIFYKGKSLSKLNSSEIRRLRTEVQFIFQDPYAALHPQKKIGNAILEPIEAHQILPFNQRNNRVIDLLDQVGLNQSYFNRYPHELSGGQRQRVVIARALAVDPSVLICDESVAALDISVQAQVLNLLNELQEKLKLSYLFISHDLSVVQFISDKIMVMDRGEIVEYKEADELYRNPQEKATQKLIEAIPKVAF